MSYRTEEEICLILDTYMYTDYEYAKDGMSLEEIVLDMPNHIDVNNVYYKEYSILLDAIKDPELSQLIIMCQSRQMGYDEGTNAVTFISNNKDIVYITYRGTHDGEWLDNGKGLTSEETIQQERAVSYYDEVVEKLDLSDNQHVVITGHSKGGNKAQYVTMDSDNGDIIDVCYSVDGQGHSSEAILKWKNKYSTDEYNERISKLYAINGENDYVSVLGECIILSSHIKYIKTPADNTDIAAFHDITRMFGHFVDDGAGGKKLIFSSHKNQYTVSMGELAKFVLSLSGDVMVLPAPLLDGCATSMMQLAEIGFGGKWIGINKEKVSILDIENFKKYGIPIILNNLFNKNEGKNFINILLTENEYSRRFRINDNIYVNYNELILKAGALKAYAKEMAALAAEIEATGLLLPFYIEGICIRKKDMNEQSTELLYCESRISGLADIQDQIGDMYREYDLSL